MKRLVEYKHLFVDLSEFIFNLFLYEKSSEISFLLLKLIKNNVILDIDIAEHKSYKYLNKQSLKTFWISCKYQCPNCKNIISLKFPISMYKYSVKFFHDCNKCREKIVLK